MNKCSIIPQVRSKEGDLVDSNLFTDLLALTGNRDEAKRYYVQSKYQEFSELDDNNEPFAKTVIETINNNKVFYKSSNDVLNDYSDQSHEGVLNTVLSITTNEALKEVVKILLNNTSKIANINFSLQEDNGMWLGRFYPNEGAIELNVRKGLLSRTSREEYAEAVVHEYIHAFTLSALNNPKTDSEIQFSKDIDTAYKAFKRVSDSNLYGFTNQYEFVAELLSNPRFVENLIDNNQSILEKVINSIKKLLGIQISSKVVDNLIKESSNFINNSTPKLIQGSNIKNLDKRKEGVVSEINSYATNRYNSSDNKSLSSNEKFMLQLHKKIKFKIGKINLDIKNLEKSLTQAKLENARNIRNLYNNGESVDSPNYKAETLRYDNVKLPLESTITDKINYKSNLTRLLSDLDTTDNITKDESNYISLAISELDEIEGRLGTYNLDTTDGQTQLAEDYLFTRLVGKSDFASLQEPGTNLSNKLLENISTYISTISEEYLNTTGLGEDVKIDIEDILKNSDDITILGKLFEGFGDYPRLEAQLIHNITMTGKEKARLESLKVGQNIIDHMKNLQLWAKANKLTNIVGQGSIRKAYAKLVETNHLERLDLVKPFTKSYYNDVNLKFRETYRSGKDTDKSVAAKKWLAENYYNKPTKGAYINTKYDYIQSQPALKEFYEFFKQTMKDNYSKLPEYINLKNEEKIPTLIKNSFWEFFSMRKGNIMRSTLTALKTILIGQGRAEFYDEQGNLREKFELQELNRDEIKLRMIGEVRADIKSFDLGKVLFEFTSFVNDYSEMMEVLPKVRMIQSIVETKDYIKTKKQGLFGASKVVIRGSESRMYDAINMYVDGKIVGKEENPWLRLGGGEIFDNEGNLVGRKSYYVSDMIRALIRYTRTLQLGFNPFSGINNILAGLMGDLVEASGGRYFTKKQLLKAISIYSSNALVEGSNKFKTDKVTTKLNLLSEYLQPLEEIGEWQDKRSIEMGSPTLLGAAVNSVTSKAFIFQEYGEDFVQKITMIAYLLNKKTPEGTPYWNMIDVKNDELEYKHEDGFDTKSQILNSRATILAINHSIHGNYSKDNSSVYDGALLFQSALVFKKWMPYMIRNRFMARRYNYQTGQNDEGFYFSGGRAISKSMGHMLNYFETRFKEGEAIIKKPGALTKEEIIGIKKIGMEMIMFLVFSTIAKVLAPPPDEEKDSYFVPNFWEHLDISMWDSKKDFENTDGVTGLIVKTMIDSSNRLTSEALQMYNASFYVDSVTKWALWSTLTEGWDVIRETFKFMGAETKAEKKNLRFKKGIHKDDLRLYKEVTDLIPYYKQIERAKTNSKKTIEDLQK